MSASRAPFPSAFLSPSKVREEPERKPAFLPIRRKKELLIPGKEVHFGKREAARYRRRGGWLSKDSKKFHLVNSASARLSTKSYNRSLHHIGDSLNPYEQAISIIGKTLAAFDEDNLTPLYGFEDGTLFEIGFFFRFLDSLSPRCKTRPTYFAPVIEMAMTIVEQNGSQYHVLVILADGQSKIVVGDVGDGAGMKLVVNVIMERICRLCSFTGCHWCTYVFDERPINGPILISYRISFGTLTTGLVACRGIRRICFPACPISAPANELYKVAKSCCISDEDFSVVPDALRVKLQNQSKE
ncbi:hypothetical protein RHMOL_Rhmol10G0025100 [Rhododendron molle]|uniref:Uncharacterized protein n=1 Tax=Rhododendron molle TaxID=49168 RepID=A0ACC0LYB7_RHOML|nr:hypothetical protein RHMOL_Rhmol10G0025100 [Rhododendron molle]